MIESREGVRNVMCRVAMYGWLQYAFLSNYVSVKCCHPTIKFILPPPPPAPPAHPTLVLLRIGLAVRGYQLLSEGISSELCSVWRGGEPAVLPACWPPHIHTQYYSSAALSLTKHLLTLWMGPANKNYVKCYPWRAQKRTE